MPRLPKFRIVKELNYKWGKKGLELESLKPNVFGIKETKRIFDITTLNFRKKR